MFIWWCCGWTVEVDSNELHKSSSDLYPVHHKSCGCGCRAENVTQQPFSCLVMRARQTFLIRLVICSFEWYDAMVKGPHIEEGWKLFASQAHPHFFFFYPLCPSCAAVLLGENFLCVGPGQTQPVLGAKFDLVRRRQGGVILNHHH